jgi:hypothetical protein
MQCALIIFIKFQHYKPTKWLNQSPLLLIDSPPNFIAAKIYSYT